MDNRPPAPGGLRTIALGLAPLLLLALVIGWLVKGGAMELFATGLPPVEKIHVLRHTLETDRIHLDVMNDGPDPSTIAQVTVRGAFWVHEITPSRTLDPLGRAHIVVPYPWNAGEPVEIDLMTSTGLMFHHTIDVASETPRADAAAFGRFALLGAYVGVIPVALGILWFPFLRRLGKTALGFLLHLTVGLLGFLVVDSVHEGWEAAEGLPSAYHGVALLALGVVGAWLLLLGVESRARAARSSAAVPVVLSWLVALGIGLHNLGEGLAIGSAYVLGEVTLGALLIVGFTLHNATEGIAIVAPILEEETNYGRLAGLGLLAGGPTILGCWIGAFSYSAVWAVLFLGVGAGAILQVIGAILLGGGRRPLSESLAPANLGGLFAGYLLMYGTSLLVTA